LTNPRDPPLAVKHPMVRNSVEIKRKSPTANANRAPIKYNAAFILLL